MANARRRANRERMFNQLLSAGYDSGTAGSIANTPNWGNANNRFNNAMANAPGKPAPAPTPVVPQQPKPVKPPSQMNATVGSEGGGVGRAGKVQPRKKLSDLRIARRKPNVNVGRTFTGRLTT